MKKVKIFLIIVISYITSWGQETKRDSLFLADQNEYLNLKMNYENYHYFFFKNEKFVSSAFGKSMIDEKFNHFVQSTQPSTFKNLKPKRIYDIKKYLHQNKEGLIDPVSKAYDSYKLLLHFNKFHVFIKHDGTFIKVKYYTSLTE